MSETKIKYKVIGKYRGLTCNPEIVEMDKEHTSDKETLEHNLRLEAMVDVLTSYEVLNEGAE